MPLTKYTVHVSRGPALRSRAFCCLCSFLTEPKHDWESNFTTSQTLLRLPDGSFRLWYAGRKQPPWSNLYFAIGTARWKGPKKE